MINFDFAGKKVLITGASGGIGQTIAEGFVRSGATVFLSGTSDDKMVNTKSALVQKFGSTSEERIFTAKCNLSNTQEAAGLVPLACEKMGGLDIFVGNAGIVNDGLMMRMSEEDFMKVINVNLLANFLMNREALKVMIKGKFGRIINISSVVGIIGNAGQANYAASKGGLIAMTKSLACEAAKRGITANVVCPGFIKTPMTDALSKDLMDKMEAEIPMGRQGESAEVAAAVLFLASNEASYITGASINVNGGLVRQ